MATLTPVSDSPGGGATAPLYAALPRSPKVATYQLTFDSSYPDGGESLADVFGNFQEVLQVHADSKGSYFFEVDYTNEKIIVFEKFSGTSETQTIELTDGPTGGTWTATYAGQTTAAVANDVSGADFETALDNLSNLADGDVEVTRSGSGTQADPYIYTLDFSGGALAGENVATLTGTGSGLTASTITIGTTTGGTGVQENQTLTLTAGVADDSFDLTFNAHESTVAVTIPPGGYANVTGAQLAATLASISDFAAANIVVNTYDGTIPDIFIDDTAGSGVYEIWFSGTLTGDVGAITVTSKTGAADGSVAETTKGVAGVSEVQTVELTDGPTGGTWALTWNGEETSALAYNASGAAVTSALEALPNILAAQVAAVRSGSGTQADPYIYTLTWRADAGNVAEPTASSVALTGGTITVGTTTQGSEVADAASLSGLSTQLVAVGF